MEGNTTGGSSDQMLYAIRLTFGIVHGVILTLFSFGISLYIPSLSHILFALLGCVVAPCLSLLLTVFCNACVEYVSQSTVTVERILRTAWIPPLGIFCVNLILMPLEMMPMSIGTIPNLVAASVVANCITSILLQIYAAKDIQTYSSKSGDSSPT